MTWRVIVSRSAGKAVKAMPKRDAGRVLAVLESMESDPFAGDLAALQGVHKGSYRRRVGSWRVLFDVDPASRTVSVTDIRRRTSTTY